MLVELASIAILMELAVGKLLHPAWRGNYFDGREIKDGTRVPRQDLRSTTPLVRLELLPKDLALFLRNFLRKKPAARRTALARRPRRSARRGKKVVSARLTSGSAGL